MQLYRVTKSVAFVALAFASTAIAGNDEFVALGARFAVRELVYGRPTAGVRTAFAGEPIEVVVTVVNNTSQAVVAGREGRHWSEDLSVGLMNDVLSASDLAVVRATRPNKQESVRLNRHNSSEVTLQLAQRNGRMLEPGRYRVQLSLETSAVNRTAARFNDRLNHEIQLEVRPVPDAPDERVDYYLHLAYSAHRTGDFGAQESFLKSALQLLPTSTAAHADLGMMWKLRGDCAKARGEFQQTIAILLGGGDQGLQMSRAAQEDWAANLQGLVAKCR
jgi:hypothetical protein